jgi:hypothetical protein
MNILLPLEQDVPKVPLGAVLKVMQAINNIALRVTARRVYVCGGNEGIV